MGKAAAGEDRRERIERLKRRNTIIFGCIVIAWFILDQVTKKAAEAHEVGAVIAEPIPGVLGFKLVHNAGGAWGMFDDMTMALVVLSLIICAIVIAYMLVIEPGCSVLMTVGLSLVFAGGFGNMVDRATGGYVIDFIQVLFVDFPVFNIADIGVTCGIAVVMAALLAHKNVDESVRGA